MRSELTAYYIEKDLDLIEENLNFFLDKLEFDKEYHESEFYEAVYQYYYRKDAVEDDEDYPNVAKRQNTKSNTIRTKIKYHHTGEEEEPSQEEMAARFELYELREAYVGPMTKRFIEKVLRNMVSEINTSKIKAKKQDYKKYIYYNKKIGELLRLI